MFLSNLFIIILFIYLLLFYFILNHKVSSRSLIRSLGNRQIVTSTLWWSIHFD